MSKFKLEKLNNAVPVSTEGFEQLITTQTEIVAGVIGTKYYELLGQTLSDFVPFDVGRGAYSMSVFQYTSAYVGSPFEAGLTQPSTGLGKNSKANIKIDGLSIKNNYWRMDYEVSHEVVEMGKANAQAFSIIEENEKARKKVWDLGIQKVAFLGIENDPETHGLLNLPNVTVNSSLFPKKLADMSAVELSAFASKVLTEFLDNNNGTQFPNRMVIQTSDFLALGTPTNPEYPLQTKLELLTKAFQTAGAPEMKILHTKYNEKAGVGQRARYVIYNYNPETLRIYIPKAYTPHELYPMNGVDFVSVAEGQFTGVQAIRPKEILYADAQQ